MFDGATLLGLANVWTGGPFKLDCTGIVQVCGPWLLRSHGHSRVLFSNTLVQKYSEGVGVGGYICRVHTNRPGRSETVYSACPELQPCAPRSCEQRVLDLRQTLRCNASSFAEIQRHSHANGSDEHRCACLCRTELCTCWCSHHGRCECRLIGRLGQARHHIHHGGEIFNWCEVHHTQPLHLVAAVA